MKFSKNPCRFLRLACFFGGGLLLLFSGLTTAAFAADINGLSLEQLMQIEIVSATTLLKAKNLLPGKPDYDSSSTKT